MSSAESAQSVVKVKMITQINQKGKDGHHNGALKGLNTTAVDDILILQYPFNLQFNTLLAPAMVIVFEYLMSYVLYQIPM